MTELILVEGVSDVQLISYYLQNVYGWKYEKNNVLGITLFDEREHLENLSKDGNNVVLCGVGGNGKFAHFVSTHQIYNMLREKDIASLMVVTDRDESPTIKIVRDVQKALREQLNVRASGWVKNQITDSFGQPKSVDTYLLIVPINERGAIEKVIIDALLDNPQEKELITEVTNFIDGLDREKAPELNANNKVNKAKVGTFFSIRFPKETMRSFSIYVSKIDWSKSPSLEALFKPFSYLGESKIYS